MDEASFNGFIKKLSAQLKKPLPGESAQYRMAPVSRPRIKDIHPFNPKESSVLILLYPDGDEVKTVLILRPDYSGVHSGQISFPGGRFETDDKYLHVTALRETAEEIGYTPSENNLLGELSQLYIPVSNYLVHPFVVFATEKPGFIPNKIEVKQIIEAGLSTLTDASNLLVKEIMHSNGDLIHTPYYNINGYTVWGATAMIVSEFTTVLKEAGLSAF